MAKYELKKSIEVTKLNKRTKIPVSGPPVTIPYGALLEDIELDYDYGKFTYLGEPYRCATDLLKASLDSRPAVVATTAPPQAAPDSGPVVAAALTPPPAEPAIAAEATALRWEDLWAGAQAEAGELRWEELRSSAQPVSRAKVPGGWLVTVTGCGLTFYPDPEHQWNGESPA
jgi:hypothetical protein